MLTIILCVVLVVIVLILVFGGIFTVQTQHVVIIERFGKFQRLAGPGLNFKMPLVERRATNIYMGVQQLDVKIDSKTKDNVFAEVTTAVQYSVRTGGETSSYYSLKDVKQQITSFVQDVVRTALASITIDETFEQKSDIATQVEQVLQQRMETFGYQITNTLITDIMPAQEVQDAMNAINAAQRQRAAAVELAEADKIKLVKAAEAEAESKRLQGEGIANQRKAIADGLADSYRMLQQAGLQDGADQTLLLTQYFDTIGAIGTSANTKTLFLSPSPSGMSDIAQQIRDAVLGAKEA